MASFEVLRKLKVDHSRYTLRDVTAIIADVLARYYKEKDIYLTEHSVAVKGNLKAFTEWAITTAEVTVSQQEDHLVYQAVGDASFGKLPWVFLLLSLIPFRIGWFFVFAFLVDALFFIMSRGRPRKYFEEVWQKIEFELGDFPENTSPFPDLLLPLRGYQDTAHDKKRLRVIEVPRPPLRIPAAGMVSKVAAGVFLSLTLIFVAAQLWPGKSKEHQPTSNPTADTSREVPAATGGAAGGTLPSASKASALEDLSVTWVRQSKGFSAGEAELWVPQMRATVRNTGNTERTIFLRAVFFNGYGVITDEPKEIVESLPPGRGMGPVFLTGSVGFTSDLPFLDMTQEEKKKWQYELYLGDSYSGPWHKVQGGVVELPPAHRNPR